MNQRSLGVPIYCFGDGSPNAPAEYVGRRITRASISENALSLGFADGKAIHIFDDGQACCEHRYMTTDDDPQSLVGHVLLRIDGKAGPDEPDDYGEHETCFVEVGTDAGFITITNHNEHNGYYGGFVLSIVEESE